MSNAYRTLKQIVKAHGLNPEELVHALMATVYTESCHTCNDHLHSDDFLKTLNRMIEEMKRCEKLSRNVA